MNGRCGTAEVITGWKHGALQVRIARSRKDSWYLMWTVFPFLNYLARLVIFFLLIRWLQRREQARCRAFADPLSSIQLFIWSTNKFQIKITRTSSACQHLSVKPIFTRQTRICRQEIHSFMQAKRTEISSFFLAGRINRIAYDIRHCGNMNI